MGILENIRVPRLEVDGEGAGSLVATLVDIAGRVVEDLEHGDNAVRIPVRAGNVRAGRANVVDVESDATCGLADHRTRLKSRVNTRVRGNLFTLRVS